MRKLLCAAFFATSTPLFAAAPQELLQAYASQARKEDPAFESFSAARGEKLFRRELKNGAGESVSCTACHTADPRQTGKTRANKTIDPLAPAANPQRLTDSAKAEKWFRRNCGDVLGRECTAVEKGDFITWLLTLK